jgi:hypothetical protein
MAVSPAPVLIDIIAFFRPLDQGKDGFAELFPVFRQGILDPWRDLREGFTVNQVFFLKIFQHICKGFGTDPAKPLLEVIKPYLLIMANDADDQNGPFFSNDIDDALKGAQADVVTFFFHSHFKTINLTLLILFN